METSMAWMIPLVSGFGVVTIFLRGPLKARGVPGIVAFVLLGIARRAVLFVSLATCRGAPVLMRPRRRIAPARAPP